MVQDKSVRERTESAKISELDPAQTDGINVGGYGLSIIDAEEGLALKDSSLLTNALTGLESFVTNHPDCSDILLNKTLCLVDLNRKEEARQILEQLVSNQTEVKDTAARILGSL
jgi:hypothetical protein